MRRPGGPGGPGFGPEGPGGPGGPPIEMIAQHLGLSDEQKTQFKAIHEKGREAGEPLMKGAGEAKEAFDQALESENTDAAGVGQAAIAMRDAHRKVEAHQKAIFDSVKAILTPEQLAKMEEMETHRRQVGPGGPQGQGIRRRKGQGGAR